eukprot:347668-Rhodomonas_salina.1
MAKKGTVPKSSLPKCCVNQSLRCAFCGSAPSQRWAGMTATGSRIELDRLEQRKSKPRMSSIW